MTAALKTKTCSKCLETKSVDEFYKDRRNKSGLRSECKVCCDVAVREYCEANRKQYLLRKKEYREANREHQLSKLKEWYETNKERHALKSKEWREANLEKIKKRREVNRERNALKAKKWREANKEHIALNNKEWAAANPEKIKAIRTKRMLVPKHKISSTVSIGVWQSIKSNKAGRHWETLVDFNLEQLMTHLESHFDSHMTWENHGTYWHIDHIQPVASFNFKAPEDPEFKQCWALENLQPLEAKQNISKGAKLDWQPIGEIK